MYVHTQAKQTPVTIVDQLLTKKKLRNTKRMSELDTYEIRLPHWTFPPRERQPNEEGWYTAGSGQEVTDKMRFDWFSLWWPRIRRVAAFRRVMRHIGRDCGVCFQPYQLRDTRWFDITTLAGVEEVQALPAKRTCCHLPCEHFICQQCVYDLNNITEGAARSRCPYCNTFISWYYSLW